MPAFNGSETEEISIHALREEGDLLRAHDFPSAGHFYPRPPRGGRQDDESLRKRVQEFLSTPSARRATYAGGTVSSDYVFLSTPSARRATSDTPLRWNFPPYFYPRPPRGGRLSYPSIKPPSESFLSTPSARRATYKVSNQIPTDKFLSTPSARRATAAVGGGNGDGVISIHALREEGDNCGCVLF